MTTKWPYAKNNIKQINPRVGNISQEYKLDYYGNPVPIDIKSLSSIFQSGPTTSGKDLNGESFPNLSDFHVGMVKPLVFRWKIWQS